MKVFIWDSAVLADAANGQIIVVAEGLESAKAIALSEYVQQFAERYGRPPESWFEEAFLKDLSAEPTVRTVPCAVLIDGSA